MTESGTSVHATSRRLEPAAPGAKVTRLELFYDLVFVYAFLNVTTVTDKQVSPAELLKSLLVLALLWFGWSSFALLGNAVRTDEGFGPLLGFATMAAVFLLVVSIPEAFGDERAYDVPVALVLPGCYLLIRTLQVLALWYAGRHDPQVPGRWWRPLIPIMLATALLALAALVTPRVVDDDRVFPIRAGLWLAAIAVEYGAGLLTRSDGLTLVSVGHWAERHALILLIAFGESVISLGVGPGSQFRLPLTWAVLGASVLGIAVIAALWWAYFDVLAIAAEQVLHRLRGAARRALARDAYTYLHLPMIAGVILLALGLKRVLAVIAEDSAGGLDIPHRRLLYGGIALYLLALLAFQLRTLRVLDRYQPIPIALLLVLGFVPWRPPAFLDLALLAVLMAGMLILQAVRSRQRRQRLRRLKLEEQRALEAEETELRRRNLGRWIPPVAG